MEVRLRLRRSEEEIEGHEAHVVDTEGKRFVMIKFPIPEGMSPGEATTFMQNQAGQLREFFQQEFILMPTRPGDTCEMGVLTPNTEDLKECVRALPPDERRAFLDEMMGEWVDQVKADVEEEDDWGHIGNSS